jgi:uncharacterized repeat protein (TIGR01451 family)
MKRSNRSIGVSTAVRAGLPIFLGMVGLLLTFAVVLAQSPDLGGSYKDDGIDCARPGDVITYTIVAVNTGNGVARDVVLSDILPDDPNGAWWVEIMSGTCTYHDGYTVTKCGPPQDMWGGGRDIYPSTSITTTFAVTLRMTAGTVGTVGLPLVNWAYLSWNGHQVPMSCTTTFNPAFIYLPLALRNYRPFTNGSFEYGLSGWRVVENPLPVRVADGVDERPSGSTSPADGAKVILLGRTDLKCDEIPVGYAAVEQTFSVPASATELAFEYIMWTQDASPSDKYDRFEVYINDELEFADGNQVSTGLSCSKWRRVPGPDNPRGGQTGGWATKKIDISAYASQIITVSFRNYSRFDNWYNTYTYIDNVRIETSN